MQKLSGKAQIKNLMGKGASRMIYLNNTSPIAGLVLVILFLIGAFFEPSPDAMIGGLLFAGISLAATVFMFFYNIYNNRSYRDDVVQIAESDFAGISLIYLHTSRTWLYTFYHIYFETSDDEKVFIWLNQVDAIELIKLIRKHYPGITTSV